MRCGGPALCSECAADAYRARAALAQPSPAQAEKAEVVARVVHSNPVVLGQCGPLNANDELMAVAQHAASVARWAEMFNRVEQQRDAALAEVERLRQFERICEGLPQDAIDGGWTVQGIRGYAKRLEDQLKAALAEVAGLRSLLNSLLCYVERDIDRMRSDRDKSDNKEIYDRSISLAMERLKAAQNAVFTTEPGCDTAVELAAQTTQAQHSVPELLVRAEDFVSGKKCRKHGSTCRQSDAGRSPPRAGHRSTTTSIAPPNFREPQRHTSSTEPTTRRQLSGRSRRSGGSRETRDPTTCVPAP